MELIEVDSQINNLEQSRPAKTGLYTLVQTRPILLKHLKGVKWLDS